MATDAIEATPRILRLEQVKGAGRLGRPPCRSGEMLSMT